MFYGQYCDNYRQGYGIMKKHNMEVYIGMWAYDHYHGYGKMITSGGQVKEMGVFRDGKLKQSALFNELS